MSLTLEGAENMILHYLAERLDPSSAKTVVAGWDGDHYCIMFGPNLQEGQGYFGETSREAVEAVIHAACKVTSNLAE